MASERSSIQWGTTQIPYVVRRSPRRGTVSVAVEADGRVVLTAPSATPIGRLDRVVRQKARWIVGRVRRRSHLPPPVAREFVSGESILYLGRSYRLRVSSCAEPGATRLTAGLLHVQVQPSGSSAERARQVRAAIVAWHRTRAEERLVERAELWSRKLRASPSSVVVRDQRQRWGSCDAQGVMRLNWRIIQAPWTLIDYVLAHELVHLLHREHGPAFWATLGRAMPDYEARKQQLLEWGPRLVW